MGGVSVQAIVVPRWGGTSADDWYPWIRTERTGVVEVLDLPDPDVPRVDVWPAKVLEAIDAYRPVVIVGHSVGCQAVLRALAMLPEGVRMPGVLCVAGWWAVDEPWETILPWMEVPDVAAVRRVVNMVHLLVSANDPFTADYEANAALWRERLSAEVEVVPHAKHFNGTKEPAVLAALDRLLGAIAGGRGE